MNVAFYGPDEPKSQLLSYLNDKQMLLILDNVEHLVGASSSQENITQLLVEILQSAPQIKLLLPHEKHSTFKRNGYLKCRAWSSLS